MSEREPITAELRGMMDTLGWYDKDGNIVFTTGLPVSEIACLAINSKTFYALCDAIDAVHAGLERENAELRRELAALDNRSESMHIGGSITDELRAFARRWPCTDYVNKDMVAIADRIDAEHEAKVSYWQGASYKDGYDEGFASADDWLEQHEDAMAEHGWVRMPKDADGEYIRIGDVMEWDSPDEDYKPVIRTVDAVGEQAFFAWSKDSGRYEQYEARAYRHYHAPTVEYVLREFAQEMNENLGMYTGEAIDADEWRDADAKTIAKYAKRLTLAGDAE